MAYTTINKSSDHFNTKLYTGNGTAIGSGGQAITGVGFQPDWTWIKNRSADQNHSLTDSVRGVTKTIRSDVTTAETTDAQGQTAFGSDGFTVGSEAKINGNGNNIVAWNWKAGTTGSGTTTGAGTGKAYSYSVNTTAGFSIVKYLGNGTVNHTIPHHLGVAPKMIITKNLDNAVTWIVGHDSITWSNILFLDTTAAQSDDSNAFNDVAPTSTVWNLGSGNGTNSNNVNYVSYCFAEKTGYSKFGSYIGNGNDGNGTFVYTGFKPEFVLVKRYNNTEEWPITDATRDKAVSPNFARLKADNSTAESTNITWARIDKFSNGFRLGGNDTVSNGSGDSYIYMAFGQSLVGSNNVPCTAR